MHADFRPKFDSRFLFVLALDDSPFKLLMIFSCDPQNGGHIEENQAPIYRCSERFSAEYFADRPTAVVSDCTKTFKNSVKNCLNFDSASSSERSFSREFMEEAWAIMHFAQTRGLRFVMPAPSVLDDIKKFKLYHQEPLGDEEKAAIDEQTEIAKIDNFYLCFNDAGNLQELTRILNSIKYFPGIDEVLNPLVDFLAKISEDISDGGDLKELWRACENVKSFLHYAIQGKAEMYHGGRFSAELTADFCGFVDEKGRPQVELVFTNEDGSPVTIIDLGCGDGDWLTTLAREKRRRERGGMISKFTLDLYEKLGILKNKLDPVNLNKFNARIVELFKLTGMNVAIDHEMPDPHLIGVDLSSPALKRLRHPASGISAVFADICSPELTQKPPLKKATAGLVGTTLTTDRVEDPSQLFANIADLLEADGRFFIATKGIIDPKTDGKGAENPIHYSSKLDLKSESPIGTAEKLIEALKKHGLEVDGLSLVPYHVISLDGPQDFSLLVVIGKKKQSS